MNAGANTMVGAHRIPASTLTSAMILGLLLIAAVLGPWLAPQDPGAQHLADAALGPGADHWLGTDGLGRDVFSRLLDGTRHALTGPLIVAACTVVLATAVGLLAGFAGGWVDALVMRAIDLIYAVPPLLVAIVVVGVLGGSYPVTVGVLVVLTAPADIRMVRSAVLAQRGLPYVEAAVTLGVGRSRVMGRHLLPNVLPTVLTNGLLDFVTALVALSALAFLGLGVQPGTPDWGLMLAENKDILDLNPAATIVPAALITLAAASVTVLGDGLYDRLAHREAR
ncbi:ABC transporter permease [Amycolatopsis sp. NPDC058986]|uniref:ABC transporter permease n=1 Tax=unclassified Amycolatopsis TaxID=2618356 RepID=UPI00366AFBBD